MAKVKMKKDVVEYNTIVPRPANRTQKGQLIVGKKFVPSPSPSLQMGALKKTPFSLLNLFMQITFLLLRETLSST
jgi:hypothetical protein